MAAAMAGSVAVVALGVNAGNAGCFAGAPPTRSADGERSRVRSKSLWCRWSSRLISALSVATSRKSKACSRPNSGGGSEDDMLPAAYEYASSQRGSRAHTALCTQTSSARAAARAKGCRGGARGEGPVSLRIFKSLPPGAPPMPPGGYLQAWLVPSLGNPMCSQCILPRHTHTHTANSQTHFDFLHFVPSAHGDPSLRAPLRDLPSSARLSPLLPSCLHNQHKRKQGHLYALSSPKLV